MNTRRTMLVLAWGLSLLAGCEDSSSKPSSKTNDAGRPLVREECYLPNENCYKGCFERKEELYCPACCFDNLIFCNEGNPYDFERCKTAETDPMPTRPPSKK